MPLTNNSLLTKYKKYKKKITLHLCQTQRGICYKIYWNGINIKPIGNGYYPNQISLQN